MAEETVPVKFHRVLACPCGEHAIAELHSPAGDIHTRVRLSHEAAQLLGAAGTQFPSLPYRLVDWVSTCFAVAGVAPAALVLTRGVPGAFLQLEVEAADAVSERHVPVDPSVGLVLSARLRLPVLLAIDVHAPGSSGERDFHGGHASTGDGLAVYRELIESLEWSGDDCD